MNIKRRLLKVSLMAFLGGMLLGGVKLVYAECEITCGKNFTVCTASNRDCGVFNCQVCHTPSCDQTAFLHTTLESTRILGEWPDMSNCSGVFAIKSCSTWPTCNCPAAGGASLTCSGDFPYFEGC